MTAARHAGELRADEVPVASVTGRDLVAIARDRADVVTRLARITARRCVEPCTGQRVERAAAAAKVDALDVERKEALRVEAAQDRATAARVAARVDPVAGALTAFGLPTASADLIAGLAFAGVLEAVACFAWLLALRPVAVTTPVAETAGTPAQQGSHVKVTAPVTTESHVTAPVALPVVVVQTDDLTRVREAVTAGTLRATVTEIRKFLCCSQSRAAAVRKQLEPAINAT
ncbi:hypothetical protein [Paraburkholderia sp. J12]|uniref:hypothetical protein n=1 Tax=Paraburkholderia sp. J12 TaxID=2805432 RepID=UPI002ABDB5DB|nr:hypothetical protein [Paraburkholderia sp. J12]